MKKNALMLAAMGCLLYGGQALAAGITSDAGADLNRTLELLERERVAQQIAEGRTKSKLKVEGTTLKPEHNETSSVTFELKKITTTPSSVLSESELESLTQGYLGKTVTVNDIYELVGKINELYIAKGYPTCRAFLGPQTIKEGCLRLTLLEGVAGQVQVINNKWTKASYIRKHLQLHENQLANVNKLNKDLLHFNSNHDVQLRIVMKAGDKGGTTIMLLKPMSLSSIMWLPLWIMAAIILVVIFVQVCSIR